MPQTFRERGLGADASLPDRFPVSSLGPQEKAAASPTLRPHPPSAARHRARSTLPIPRHSLPRLRSQPRSAPARRGPWDRGPVGPWASCSRGPPPGPPPGQANANGKAGPRSRPAPRGPAPSRESWSLGSRLHLPPRRGLCRSLCARARGRGLDGVRTRLSC